MPDMDGMTAAKKLRGIDKIVTIVFVTNLQQYAINGYSVSALDFLVKPLTYVAFTTVMRKALKHIKKNISDEIVIKSAGGARRVAVGEISYVEINAHRIYYRLVNGQTIETWGTLSEVAALLPQNQFIRCSSHYIINLAQVKKIEGLTALLNNKSLIISRNKKSQVLSAFARYMGT